MTVISQEILILALGLAAAGAVAGCLAGLFGIGGGAILVPVLFEAFGILDVAEPVRMPLAVGTSLAIIAPTSIRSAWAHRAHGAVDMGVLRAWAIPLLMGVGLGALLAGVADPWVFQLAFVVVSAVIATKLLAGRVDWRIADEMPTGPLNWAYGGVIGFLSALMGVGGGAMATLVQSLYNRPIHAAVATAAGVGVIIAGVGAIGYVAAGWGRPGLPPDAIGFVSLLALVVVTPTSFLTAKLGVTLAHALSRRRLEILFGLFLMAVSLRFVVAIVTG